MCRPPGGSRVGRARERSGGPWKFLVESGRNLSSIDGSVLGMTAFVLVPGFFLGAWAWRPVTVALRAGGHEVHPISLTGLGERAHLSSPSVDLETHITDVLNLLRFEDLHDVVLVGHSYGAIVTPAVAARMPERVAKLLYVHTGPLLDGTSQHDFAQQAPPPD